MAGSNKIPNINPKDIGFGIKTYVPTIDYYLDLIKSGTNFKFIRCNHGMLDPFARAMNNDELYKLIETKQYREVAERVADYHTHKHAQLKRWHGNKDVVSRGNSFLSLTQNLDKTYFHGGLVRHYAVTGEIYQLFDLLNELDYDVIFVGAPYFKMAEVEYKIKNFKHIPISYTNAIERFGETIDMVKSTINKKETIIFNSCGHDLTFLLANSIKGIDVSQMDIGRALDWNINKSFIRKNHTNEFNNLPNGIYKPWEKYGENPWLVTPRPTHMDVIRRLRNG